MVGLLQRGLGIAAEERVDMIAVGYGVHVLQRGLGIAAEESHGDPRGLSDDELASTWPRHRCRGETADPRVCADGGH